MNCLAIEPATLQADEIETRQFDMITERHAIRNNVAIDARDPADHRTFADSTMLLDCNQAAQYDALANLDVPCQGGAVGKCHIIGDVAVVSDMTVGHEVAIVADLRRAAAGAAAATYRHRLPHHAVRTDHELGLRKLIGANLSLPTQNGLRMDDRAIANSCVAADHDVRKKTYALAKNDVAANHTERANVDPGA